MRTIDGHTFDENLLTGGWVIDVGCRGLDFAATCMLEGSNVFALDIENFEESDLKYFKYIKDLAFAYNVEFRFKHAALTNRNGKTKAYKFGNGTGNFIEGINDVPYNGPDRPCETIEVDCITLDDIYNDIGKNIDLLKIDAEGIEYLVLQDFKPIPRMLTVETHQHCHTQMHDKYWNDIYHALCKDYHCNLYIREWPQYLFNDCLFIRKDLL